MRFIRSPFMLFSLLFGVGGALTVASGETLLRPAFTEASLFPVNETRIAAIVAGQSADLVLLGDGLRQNLRQGAFCVVERDGEALAELVIVDADRDHAVALIVQLSGVTLQPGDRVRLRLSTR